MSGQLTLTNDCTAIYFSYRHSISQRAENLQHANVNRFGTAHPSDPSRISGFSPSGHFYPISKLPLAYRLIFCGVRGVCKRNILRRGLIRSERAPAAGAIVHSRAAAARQFYQWKSRTWGYGKNCGGGKGTLWLNFSADFWKLHKITFIMFELRRGGAERLTWLQVPPLMFSDSWKWIYKHPAFNENTTFAQNGIHISGPTGWKISRVFSSDVRRCSGRRHIDVNQKWKHPRGRAKDVSGRADRPSHHTCFCCHHPGSRNHPPEICFKLSVTSLSLANKGVSPKAQFPAFPHGRPFCHPPLLIL